MKKILIVVCAVLLFLVVGTMYSEGLFDTRFWFYDHNVYDEFHRGSHVGGKDLEPGTYVVEIQGGSKDTGHISISKPKWMVSRKKSMVSGLRKAKIAFNLRLIQARYSILNVMWDER